MSSFDEVEAAEARMNAANDELLNYMEKHNTIDRDHHRGTDRSSEEGADRVFEGDLRVGGIGAVSESHSPPSLALQISRGCTPLTG